MPKIDTVNFHKVYKATKLSDKGLQKLKNKQTRRNRRMSKQANKWQTIKYFYKQEFRKQGGASQDNERAGVRVVAR